MLDDIAGDPLVAAVVEAGSTGVGVAGVALDVFERRECSERSPGKEASRRRRFIQTALREWAWAHAYHTSAQCAEHLPRWLHCYNWHRPHARLKAKTPISRIGLTGDNLLKFHSQRLREIAR